MDATNPCPFGEFAILGRWIPTSLIGMTLLFFRFDDCELLHAIALDGQEVAAVACGTLMPTPSGVTAQSQTVGPPHLPRTLALHFSK